ncbi:MAG TPA: CsbD family protein [Dehalococcoidia bacterium]|nr:CsbD family protein [Dehalococcoidia bacterium]
MDRDRVKGKSKVVTGGIKAKAGEFAGNDDLKQEGKAERTEGKVQGAVGKVKDAARDIRDTVKDSVKH